MVNNRNMMKYIIFFIISLLLIMPIELQIKYDEKNSSVKLNFIKLFNLQISISRFLKLLLTTKNQRDIITLESIIYNTIIFLKSKKLIKSLCSLSYIKKISFVAYESYEHPHMITSTWVLINYVKEKLHEYFYKVYNEYYIVLPEEKTKLRFYTVVQIRIILIILGILFNTKEIFKIRKFMKVYYGKSNI